MKAGDAVRHRGASTTDGGSPFGRIAQRGYGDDREALQLLAHSSAWRVRIALAWKGLRYELVPVTSAARRASNIAASSSRETRCSRCRCWCSTTGGGPFVLTQSMAIIEYLEERHPDPPLLPREPRARARVRELAAAGELRDPAAAEPDAAAEICASAGSTRCPSCKASSTAGLGALEQGRATERAASSSATRPTLADIYLVPQLYAARRFGVNVDDFPTLRRIERPARRCRPSNARTPTCSPIASRARRRRLKLRDRPAHAARSPPRGSRRQAR